jgi:septal ring factor EnvC (AmiA/AmiB activator)
MSSVYNPEAETKARIEQLEMEIRDVRRRIEHVGTEQDKRVLNKQIAELREEIEHLRSKLD